VNIDFPLMLVILVFGSGAIWALDALTFAPARKRRSDALKTEFPQWDKPGSSDEHKYMLAAKASASEPAIVEYARSFFPVLAAVFVLRSFLVVTFEIHRWSQHCK
jgi:signal peptidase I